MKIIVKIGRGKVDHAADYEPEEGKIKLYCNFLKYPYYFASVRDPKEPNENNITCKKCLSIMKGGN